MRAFAAVVLLALAAAGSAGAQEPRGPGALVPGGGSAPVSATATLSPRMVLFGDTVTAHVDVVVDQGAADPEQVQVTWEPAPWTQVRPPERRQEESGDTALVRTTFVLRCLVALCIPARETEVVELPPARIAYQGRDGSSSLSAPWPPLVVHTRIHVSDAAQRDALAAPWRADLVSLPAATFRVPPGLVLVLLVGLGALLVAVAAVVVYRIRPRRAPAPEPEPPPPALSPLEQALALLESPVSVDGAGGRRRALELVADEVERLGDEELALALRALAWSAEAPAGERTKELAAQLRSRLESTNGDVA
jgi:hypothetical protein